MVFKNTKSDIFSYQIVTMQLYFTNIKMTTKLTQIFHLIALRLIQGNRIPLVILLLTLVDIIVWLYAFILTLWLVLT